MLINSVVRASKCSLAAIAMALLFAACGGGGHDAAIQPKAATKLASGLGAVVPQTGIWWNPAEAGRGYAIEQQGNQVSMGAYMYEASGLPAWYVAVLTGTGDGSYVGSMQRYSGGQTLSGSYRAPMGATTVANVTLTTQTATSASLFIEPTDGGPALATAIERFSLSTSPSFAPSAAAFESGLWWNESESGRGFFIDVQGSQAAIGSYMYDSSGQPVWYVTSGVVSSGQWFQGTLEQYSNGQTLTGAYRSSMSRGSAGNITFVAQTSTTANLVLPDGTVIPLKRFRFASIAPGGATGEPSSGSTDCAAPTISPNLPPMVDSLGRQVAEADFGGGDSGAAGADGTAGDGAPIADALVTLTDNAGHSVTAATDTLGYYRLSVKCLTPPFIAKVRRSNGTEWYSPSIAQVKPRGFVTINITGLTDKASGYIADSANIPGGAGAVTPAVLATNASALPALKTKLGAALTAPLVYAGLEPATFDPVETPYQAVKGDRYDFLLDRLSIGKDVAGRSVVVATFAGVKEPLINGTGSTAALYYPQGVAVDASGVVYVADTNNHAIRKITPEGLVSTLAGSGVPGLANGSGTAAAFNRPFGVAVDSRGDVYVADFNNNAVRKITAAGVVTTLARADFSPTAVAVDSSGNAYITDYVRQSVRRITKEGVVSTLAGSGSAGFANGTGTAASFKQPFGVAVDSNGNVYVADSGNSAIRKITPAGMVTTLAGGSYGFTDGAGAAAKFGGPQGIAVNGSGNVYVGDFGNGAIRKITPEGVVSTLAGNGTQGFVNGTGAAATFNFPQGVAADGNGNVYVADAHNDAIRKITPAQVVTTLAGGSFGFVDGTGTTARFNLPEGVAADSDGSVYVADTNNHAVRKITREGVVSTLAGTGSPGFANGIGTAATFNRPSGVAVDSNGNLYVADSRNHAIRKISPAGVVSTFAGGWSGFSNGIATAASFKFPAGVAVDRDANVYVADYGNSAIRKITPAGLVSTLAGTGSPGFVNGTGTSASFSNPRGVAVDGSGNVYVADYFLNNAIRKITPDGMVSTFAGNGSAGLVNGTGTAASFNGPQAIAVDRIGNVYVGEIWNSTLRKITPAGVVSTLAGSGSSGFTNGTGAGATFKIPTGVAVDNNGNLFVADSQNNAIRLILP